MLDLPLAREPKCFRGILKIVYEAADCLSREKRDEYEQRVLVHRWKLCTTVYLAIAAN